MRGQQSRGSWQVVTGAGQNELPQRATRRPRSVERCRYRLREATDGEQMKILPQVWAVAVDGAARPARRAEQRPPDEATQRTAEQNEELAFYRKYTEALLRRYQRFKLQAGRVPSPMQRDVFQGRRSHYKVEGFDDAVIFCADTEACLRRLNEEDQRLLRRIAVQQYTMSEAAGLLGMSLRSCTVLYRRALDRVTRLFLQARLLEPEKSVSRGGSERA